ncbi:CDP-glucose 4,6-dehydratase [Rhizobium alvei]|uniref:CDP-glucose 4,6-dehydratase n=1 Tax=Rhizobium alvei TaxID=1132659 RepID=A0ABT8YFJ6_9HYPH|nr:CDP-glucose 4,6-dehydratase [Rhizobium alvei]MDO6962476.1 CDP-glucose 4,6-dehydratase [Rhizobium alvei]
MSAVGFWQGKRVLLTGHTGFKGSWLSLRLEEAGAEVHGLALAPDTEPSLYRLLHSGRSDGPDIVEIRDRDAVVARIKAVQPEIVFHFAAQPLVRAGYRLPVETFETNVQGTVHLLDALREVAAVRSIVVITTDKVYENEETGKPFVETDPLGGHDPYSASKAAADIVTASYRRSFFAAKGIGVATARAGNVIGGGDWAADRLIPDAVRAFTSGQPLDIRRPEAIRPWQHVLEPLHGYMALAEALWANPDLAPAYNFGPDPENAATVRTVLELSARHFGDTEIRWGDGQEGPHEAGYLMLDSHRAHMDLGIRPQFTLVETLARTWTWYSRWQAGADARSLCLDDIRAYRSLANPPGVPA